MKISLLQGATLCLLAFGMLFPFAASAQTADARQELQSLSMATSLDREGLDPWHLRMSFDLYDLNGKKQESGTIEEWWASSKSHRIVISSPSYTETFPSQHGQPNTRGVYLVNLLLRQVTHPVDNYARYKDLSIESEKKSFGKVKLVCLHVGTGNAAKDPGNIHWDEICKEPNTNILRAHFDTTGFSDLRNRLGDFLNTSVALDDTINYSGIVAITGHVDQLETYHPDPPAVETSDTPTIDPPKEAVRVPAVVAGHRIKIVQPVYPIAAKMERTSGSVLLHAIISREGTISSLVVIASPDEGFSRSATDAVKQWVYTPYLLNGKPTNVDTTITVNFTMR
jgi:TonB family protein